MRKHCLVTLFVALVTAPLSAQDGVCNFDLQSHYEQVSRYANRSTTTDSKSWLMRTETPHPTNELPHLMETWYTARWDQGSQTAPFYRLYSANTIDHMDSRVSDEGQGLGYVLSRTLDFPWTRAAESSRTPGGTGSSGLLPIRRYLKSSPFDHKTWRFDETPSGYALDVTYDGAISQQRLGYQRFGNKLMRDDIVGNDGSGSGYGLHFLNNGVLRIDFNHIWGNGIGRITQIASGRQIVSESIGDMVQSVVRFPDGLTSSDADCRDPNPTQSGSAWAQNYHQTEYWTGSPVLSSQKTTISSSQELFTSIVRPFEFVNDGYVGSQARWFGAEDLTPMAWKGFIERSDTLSCKIGATLRKDVLKSVSRLRLAPNGSFSSHAVYSLNTYWLKPKELVNNTSPVVWDFTVDCVNLRTAEWRRLIGDANGNTIVNAEDATCGKEYGDDPPDDHAIVVARKDGAFGYSVVRLNLVKGEATNVWFRCAVNPCDDRERGAVIIQPIRNRFSVRSTVSKSNWSFPLETFLVVNNKTAMVNRINEIRNDGGDCLN